MTPLIVQAFSSPIKKTRLQAFSCFLFGRDPGFSWYLMIVVVLWQKRLEEKLIPCISYTKVKITKLISNIKRNKTTHIYITWKPYGMFGKKRAYYPGEVSNASFPFSTSISERLPKTIFPLFFCHNLVHFVYGSLTATLLNQLLQICRLSAYQISQPKMECNPAWSIFIQYIQYGLLHKPVKAVVTSTT